MLVTVGAGSDTWTPAEDIYVLHDALDDLDDWLSDAGRPWFGSATFAVSVDWDTDYCVAQVTCSTTCTYAPDSELQTLFGWPSSGQTSTAIYSDPGVPSAVAAETDLDGWIRQQAETGRFSREGAYCIGQQRVAHRVQQFEMLADELRSAWMTAALVGASKSRTAYVWHHSESAWRLVYLGRIDRSRAQMPIYRYTAEVIG